MSYIDHQRQFHRLSLLLRLTGISSSSYQRWRNNDTDGQRKTQDKQLRKKIIDSWKRSRKNYGSPRIRDDLRGDGVRVGRARILRLMRLEGIQGRYNRPKRPKTTDSRHNQRISSNELKDRPFPQQPREVVVTDTTYVRSNQGWHYLATVMDLYTREIVGWSFGANNATPGLPGLVEGGQRAGRSRRNHPPQ